jgi:hypothetical protein
MCPPQPTTDIVFGTEFATSPLVFISVSIIDPLDKVPDVAICNVSATGFTIVTDNMDRGQTIIVYWLAISS